DTYHGDANSGETSYRKAADGHAIQKSSRQPRVPVGATRCTDSRDEWIGRIGGAETLQGLVRHDEDGSTSAGALERQSIGDDFEIFAVRPSSDDDGGTGARGIDRCLD